jgi:hypothetical protein
MRPLRGGVALEKSVRLAALLGAACLAGALAGCAGPPADLEASYRPSLLSGLMSPDGPRRLTHSEAEAVIARAITEHEMRNP